MKVSKKLIPMLTEMVQSIGCDIVEVSIECEYIIFKNNEKWYELDTHLYGDSYHIVLCELEGPIDPERDAEIKVNEVLYKGEIHDPDSLNKVKEIIQQHGSGANK